VPQPFSSAILFGFILHKPFNNGHPNNLSLQSVAMLLQEECKKSLIERAPTSYV
jgi:hypothetical protein